MINPLSDSPQVPRVSTLSAEVFMREHANTLTPVVLTDLTRSWPAREKWGTEYFKQTVGDIIVPLYSSAPATGTSKQDAAATRMPIRQYLTKLQNGESDLRMFFYNILAGAPKLVDDFSYPDCGLKFFKRLPVLFVGGKNAKVQMHYDIDLANIFLCHFGGKKRVLLYAPDQTRYLYKVPYSFSSLHKIDYSNPDTERYPALKKLGGQVAELNHGDILYIPSGYWHYVVYDEIGYSLSLRAFPTSLKQKLALVKNIGYVRTIENLMRKLQGQRWVERNEALAVTQTHDRLGL